VDLNESQKIFLLNEFDQIADTFDMLLIDTGAGISSNVLYFNMAAPNPSLSRRRSRLRSPMPTP